MIGGVYRESINENIVNVGLYNEYKVNGWSSL